MSFLIVTSGEGKDLVVILENQANGTKAEIFALGAILNQYGIVTESRFVNCIAAYSTPEDAKKRIIPAFYGAKLSPFVCRLTDGTFAFEGKEYHTGKHFDGSSAIHGLVFDSIFSVKETEIKDDYAKLTLFLSVDASSLGFPFAYDILISYTLRSNNAIEVHTIVENKGQSAMPLNDGWHPYFKLDQSLNDSLLQFRSEKMAVFSEKLLPTGEFVDYNEFHEFKPIGETFLDNSFTLEPSNKPALQLKSEQNKLLLSVTPNENYPILQIYTPPTRDCIAVENLTGLPDSFNNHIGLLVLDAGQSKSFSTEYLLEKLS